MRNTERLSHIGLKDLLFFKMVNYYFVITINIAISLIFTSMTMLMVILTYVSDTVTPIVLCYSR